MCAERPPRVPAERPFAGRFGVQADRLAHMRGFVVAGEILVVDPFEAVGGDLPAGLAHGGDDLRIALKRARHAEHGDRNIARGEQPPQPPEAGARAVFEHQFHVHVALAAPGLRRRGRRREKPPRPRSPCRMRVLAALLEIDHELQRHAGAARPARIGRIAAVTGEIARIIGWGRPSRLLLQKRPGRPTMAEAWPRLQVSPISAYAMLSRHAIDRVRPMPPLRAASSWE